MSNIKGIYPKFTTAYVQDVFSDYVGEIESKEIEILSRIGEDFVNKAKLIVTYKDRTENLRSSIGYMLINNGKYVRRNISSGKSSEGKEKAKEYAEELKSEFPSGFVLIGFAGMEYAAAVESKNYDVISGSAPTEKIMKDAFKKFL